LIDHRKALAIVGAFLGVVSTFALFLRFRPLWNLRVYQALRLPQIDKLSGIPVVGDTLRAIVNLCTIGLPWFVTNSRTLDAWVGSQRNLIEQVWEQETLPGRASASLQQREIESTSYIPLPIRLADPQSGAEIQEPSAGEISKLFSHKRTVIEVLGPGGAGKTTFARQVGRWALLGGRPGGFPNHAMIPVWIDEDMTAGEKPLVEVVKGKLAAILPEEKLDDAFLRALLKKQRLLVILDRLSERSAATQQYIGTIYRSTRVEALLITARTYVLVDGSTPLTLHPQSLNQDSLLHFMTSLLKAGASGNEDVDSRPTVSLEEQLAMGEKLATLYRASVRADGKRCACPSPAGAALRRRSQADYSCWSLVGHITPIRSGSLLAIYRASKPGGALAAEFHDSPRNASGRNRPGEACAVGRLGSKRVLRG
jgi:hypothetical protein